MMKTIGQIIHQNKFPFEIRDLNNYTVYLEEALGYWSQMKREKDGNVRYSRNSSGFMYDSRS